MCSTPFGITEFRGSAMPVCNKLVKTCSTPFGITEFRGRSCLKLLPKWPGAQRLSASRSFADQDTCSAKFPIKCSTPFGITEFRGHAGCSFRRPAMCVSRALKAGQNRALGGLPRQRWTARFDTSCKVISKESGDKTPRSEVDASLRDLNSGSQLSRGPESFSLAHRQAGRGLSSSASAVFAQRMRTAVLAAALAIPFLQ